MATSRVSYDKTTTVYTIISDIELFMEEGHEFHLDNQNYPYEFIAFLRNKINDGVISPLATFNDIYYVVRREDRIYPVILLWCRNEALDRNKRTKIALRKMK